MLRMCVLTLSAAALLGGPSWALAQSDMPQPDEVTRFSKLHRYMIAKQPGSLAEMYVDSGSHPWQACVRNEDSESLFHLHMWPVLQVDGRDVLPRKGQFKHSKGSSIFSRFTTFNRLRVNLLQTLAPGPMPGAFVMTRRVHFTNRNATAVDVPVTFTLNASVYVKDAVADYGHLAHSSQWAYLLGRPDPQAGALTDFIGVSSAGLGRTGLAVMNCCDGAEFDDRRVDGDADGDRVSDSAQNRVLVSRRWLHLEPGESQTMYFDTLFGRSALSGLGDLPIRRRSVDSLSP